ncbi:diphthine--ammonia ligase [Flavobacterium psychrophilum]|uniref:Dph6-related ATP pyrophosphatase n=1 Tax=Flavobacterium psychrophilum TaxID=96345 RepID=UPI0004E7F6C4|nr:diphthine--ammonia ligase [Flavobacterium psychrophilum]AIJ37903.1 ATP-binding region [Flavobacterium psychrophilum]AIN71662.1 ATP-binding domain-containing protein [Flavobacterium psychrophilum FPG101]AKC19145.1 ATP-binding domain-containing protein [Flavobacterium psychrophilum]AKC23885.1 ATP-binding domain-containing protein [Flavobacterium psychrophilum]AKC28513.1 ATP-binding domain-containing protein [Flavobacterium psychrophilum]
MKKKAIFNWSSGKDSALALYKTLQDTEIEIVSLLTSVNKKHNRISMHGVRTQLLVQQAKSIGLPLHIMEIPEMPSMNDYEEVMQKTLKNFKEKGISHSIFGDIFLEDLRKYRENKLAEMQLEAIFPLWKIPTKALILEFLALGFKTIVVCVNERNLDKSFVGRVIDAQFIADLPDDVDLCGENGEFHTFTFDGPIFEKPIDFEIGEIVYRKYEKPKQESSNTACDTSSSDAFDFGFWYCDLIPK